MSPTTTASSPSPHIRSSSARCCPSTRSTGPCSTRCRSVTGPAGGGRIRLKLRTVLADSGYVSEENFARADDDGLRLLAPLAKGPGRQRSRPPERTRHLDQYPATTRARRRLQHPRGQEDYKMRARTVEPVFGQLKACQKLTTMSDAASAPAKAAPAPPGGMGSAGPLLQPGPVPSKTAGSQRNLDCRIPIYPYGFCHRLGYASRALVVWPASR